MKLKKYVQIFLDFFRVIDCLTTIFYEQIEKDYKNHYNEFLHILVFVIVF